ncbi:hypothetical protein OSB04_017078 [Centaurea solstitialis]|uniref:Integrase catalytic domain-containing protein n=1 Tax=Centaurea solstitialis TaxID=347529 RepID=A0AA38T287_9ASTR|nr:hypothetical protein OSB04_017078 [Centaurea solstitialis]
MNTKSEFRTKTEQKSNQGQRSSVWHVDSGCSRHMTGIMSLLEDFKRFEGGHVAFGDNPKEGKISGKVRMENKTNLKVKVIRSDNGTEFKNADLNSFCEEKGIERQYSTPRTPEQNGVAERRNRTLIEAARTMLADSKLPITFWAEAVNIACYVQNRVLIVKSKGKTPYELFEKKKPFIGFLKPFGCPCTILDTKTHLGKFKSKSDDGFLVGYSAQSKALRVFNSSTKIIKESDNVRCNENTPNLLPIFEEPQGSGSSINEPDVNDSNLGVNFPEEPLHLTRTQKNHPPSLVIGDIQSPMITRKQSKAINDPHSGMISIFLSQTEPKKAFDAIKDPSWIEAMQEEQLQFVLQHVWDLVDLPKGHNVIVTKNKARLVAQGYTQEEGIDYDDVFAPVARIEAIRLFLAFAPYKGFKVYQMDVKSAFLYGTIDEEAPRAWYDTLSSYLLDNQFERGVIDKTLFIKRTKTDVLLVLIYVDDIIFGSTKEGMCKEFEELMHKKFKMSSMGELTFFLGLQVKQKTDGIFINQSKYVASMLQKFGMSDAKPASTPIETHKHLLLMYQVRPKESHLQAVKRIFKYQKGQPRLGLWYPNDSSFNLVAYTDSDYGGANLDRKSTSGGCQFLGARLVSWQCKKQTTVSQSTTEAEYIAASHCCSQVLWIQNQMLDYGLSFLQTPIYIDNNSAISIVNNPIKHSKTKHMEIKYHFIRDCNEKKLIQVLKVDTDDQFADLFTKAFDVGSGKNDTRTFLNYIAIDQVRLPVNESKGVKSIHTTIYGQSLTVNPQKIRQHLRFNDEGGITMLSPSDIMDAMLRMDIKVFSNMKRPAKGSNDTFTPLFSTMMGCEPPTRYPWSDAPLKCKEGASKEKDGHVDVEAHTTGVAQARLKTSAKIPKDPIREVKTSKPGEGSYTNTKLMADLATIANDLKTHDANFQLHEKRHESHEERLDMLEKLGAQMASMHMRISALHRRYSTLASFTKGEKKSKVVVDEAGGEAEAKGETKKEADLGKESVNEDEQTIAELLLMLPKVISKGMVIKEKQSEVKKKDAEIDPKDKGKKILVEEPEPESDDEQIPAHVANELSEAYRS